MTSNRERRSPTAPAAIVTRTFGSRHRSVAEGSDAFRVESKTLVPEASAVPAAAVNGISVVGGMIPMRAKLPSSMEPAKHDIDVPELPALTQVSELVPELVVAATQPAGASAGPTLDSGVYLSPDLAPQTDVTLVVYAWHNVQPGVLSWIFPTVRAALSAAYAMRNAVRWAIVRGRADANDLDLARLSGDVLIENT